MSSTRRAFALAAILVLAALFVPLRPARAAGVGALQPPFSDVPVDTDANGLANVLRVTVPVNVSTAGEFLLHVEMSGVADAWNDTNLPAGVTSVLVDVPGWQLAYAGSLPSYNFSILLLDPAQPYGTPMDTAAYTTTAYPVATFEPTPVRIQGPFSDVGVDTNGDGLYDDLVVDFVANVTADAQLQISGSLSAGTTQIDFAGGFLGSLHAGLYPMNLTYPGPIIVASGSNGPYSVIIQAEASWIGGARPADSVLYTTAAYAVTSFNPPWVRMHTGCRDHGVDADGNGLYDHLVVSVNVSVDRDATFQLQSALGPYNMPGSPTSFELGPGNWTLDLSFDGIGIYRSQASGPYSVTLFMTVVGLWIYSTQVCTTSAYTYWQFERPTLAFPGTPTYRLVDLDQDGQADLLEVDVPVSASHSRDVYFTASIRYDLVNQSLEDERLVHLETGTTTITFIFSGIDLNRASRDGAWNLTAEGRVVGDMYDDSVATWPTPAYARSAFESQPVAVLSGTVGVPMGLPSGYGYIRAEDPTTGFYAVAYPKATGAYSLPLYNGTFNVLFNLGAYYVPPYYSPDYYYSEADVVTVAGATVANRTMAAHVARTENCSLSLSSWGQGSVLDSETIVSEAPYDRFFADAWGNLDGFANESELNLFLKDGSVNPFDYWTGPLVLRIDGMNLARSDDAVRVGGADVVTSTAPLSATWSANISRPAPAATQPSHTLRIQAAYDSTASTMTLDLRFPNGFTPSFTIPTNVSVSSDMTGAWTIDPGNPPGGAYSGLATITAAAVDAQPPVAVIAPTIAERAVPIALDGSGSTDNGAIVNYSWTATVNGTARSAYGATWTTSFSEIGTYEVTLTVRDEAGLTASTTRMVAVKDTHPPPTPQALLAVLIDLGRTTAVGLSWLRVRADDLAMYRVYRSADNGTTFSLVGQVRANVTDYTDASMAAGASYVYAVTSVDRYGNEAAPSEPARIDVPPSDAGYFFEIEIALWIAVGITLAVLAVAAFVFLWRPRKPPMDRPPTD